METGYYYYRYGDGQPLLESLNASIGGREGQIYAGCNITVLHKSRGVVYTGYAVYLPKNTITEDYDYLNF